MPPARHPGRARSSRLRADPRGLRPRQRRGPRAWATTRRTAAATATPTETGRSLRPPPGRPPPAHPRPTRTRRLTTPAAGLGADPHPAGDPSQPRVGPGRAPLRDPHASRRAPPCDGDAAADALRALATASPAPRPDPALAAEPDRRRATRESLPATTLAARPRAPSHRRPSSQTTSGRHWSRPGPSPRRRWPASSPSLPKTATDPGATAAPPSRSSPSRCRSPPRCTCTSTTSRCAARPPSRPPSPRRPEPPASPRGRARSTTRHTSTASGGGEGRADA